MGAVWRNGLRWWLRSCAILWALRVIAQFTLSVLWWFISCFICLIVAQMFLSWLPHVKHQLNCYRLMTCIQISVCLWKFKHLVTLFWKWLYKYRWCCYLRIIICWSLVRVFVIYIHYTSLSYTAAVDEKSPDRPQEDATGCFTLHLNDLKVYTDAAYTA